MKIFIALYLASFVFYFPMGSLASNRADHVVISEISTRRAGDSESNLKDEFVELYNPTDTKVNIDGWKIQYKSKEARAFRAKVTFPVGAFIRPYGFYLASSNDYTGQVAADMRKSWGFGLADDAGSLRLTDANKKVIDLVGWGDEAKSFEGRPAPSSGESIERKPGKLVPAGGNWTDTDFNGDDFIPRRTRQPQNSMSAQEYPAWVPKEERSGKPVEEPAIDVEDEKEAEAAPPEKAAKTAPSRQVSPVAEENPQEEIKKELPQKKKESYLASAEMNEPEMPEEKRVKKEKKEDKTVQGESQDTIEVEEPRSKQDFMAEDAKEYIAKNEKLKAVDMLNKIRAEYPQYYKATKLLEELKSETEKKLERDDYGLEWKGRFYAEALVAYIKSDIPKAISLWKRTLEFDPQNKEVNAYYKFYIKKIDDETKALEEKKEREKLQSILDGGIELFKKGDYTGAIEKFNQVLSQNRVAAEFKTASEYILKAQEEMKRQKEEAARKKAEAERPKPEPSKPAVKEKHKPESHPVQKPKPPEVSNNFKYDPDKAEELYKRGLIEYSEGHLNKALATMELVLKYNPKHEKARQALYKIRSKK